MPDTLSETRTIWGSIWSDNLVTGPISEFDEEAQTTTEFTYNIFGLNGDDHIQIYAPTGIVDAGAGDDLIEIGIGGDTVEPEADGWFAFRFFFGIPSPYKINAGLGDDTVLVGGGIARGNGLVIDTGDGNDHLKIDAINASGQYSTGDGDDTVITRGGISIIETGAGNDTVFAGDMGLSLVLAGEGNDVIHVTGTFAIILTGDGQDTILLEQPDLSPFMPAPNDPAFSGPNGPDLLENLAWDLELYRRSLEGDDYSIEIVDWTYGEDVIDLSALGITDFSALSIDYDISEVTISFEGGSIRLINSPFNSYPFVDEDSFIFAEESVSTDEIEPLPMPESGPEPEVMDTPYPDDNADSDGLGLLLLAALWFDWG